MVKHACERMNVESQNQVTKSDITEVIQHASTSNNRFLESTEMDSSSHKGRSFL